MHILHIAAELAPVAKVGGLADVLGGLSSQLSKIGHDVDIILPKYDCMDSDAIDELDIVYSHLKSYFNGSWYTNTVWVGWVGSLKVYLLDPHHPDYFFDRGCIYGCDDDIKRFLYFNRAAMEFIYKQGLNPDAVHIHDWQTSAIALLYKDMYAKWGLKVPKITLTIHNLAYQGKCSPEDLNLIGIDGTSYLKPEKLQDNARENTMNLLKGGIVYADAITTVSPSYAKEILEPVGGQGLEVTLKKHSSKLYGVLNGIDYEYWNPETDGVIPAHYSYREIPLQKGDRNTIDKKAYIKKSLREHLMLEQLHRPIVGTIARLVPQKGLDLIKASIDQIVDLGGQFVFLGSGPIPSINAEFHSLRHHYLDHPHVRIMLQHDEALAHMMYAGCDMMVVPSLFEPCGLVQLISLRYGTVPIVHKTGGLADTVFDLDVNGIQNKANGYTFEQPQPELLHAALSRAIHCWYEHPDTWRQLVVQGMTMDYSWKQSASKYLEIYTNTSK